MKVSKFIWAVAALFVAASIPLSCSGEDRESTPHANPPILMDEHKLQGTDFQLTQVTLWDCTDGHDEPVRMQEQPIPDQEPIALTGSIFVVQNTANQDGLIFIRQSPMPGSRPEKPEMDIELKKQQDSLSIKLYRADYENEEHLWHVIKYNGGALERIRALQTWQRSLRPNKPIHRIPTFITNTWGDRSRDSRISEKFILQEIAAAEKIGADVVRIDDGWQTGLSGNSAFQGNMKTRGLSGFWGVSDAFWQVNKERFPNGLKPVLTAAKKAGIEIGLWYAPDSEHEFTNWEKDAETILELYKAHGVRFFKIDGLDGETPLAQERVTQLLSRIAEQSDHEILLMIDSTGGKDKRPGFLGAIPYGKIFVQNRYTDFAQYWPHRTLRSLWRLSHWVDPMRLRFETLNNTRNTNHEKYRDNPLAPANYPADYLFASVMMSNPLGWYEISNLPKKYCDELAPLVNVWRQHRNEISESSIIPIGQEPSGHSWTGFMTLRNDEIPDYLLFLREFSETDTYTYKLPVTVDTAAGLVQLHGNGTATLNGNEITVKIKDKPGYLFLKIKE